MIKDARRENVIGKYDDLFKNNHTIKDLTKDITLKNDYSKPMQQKRKPVPIHFQNTIRQELENLNQKGHPETADKTTEIRVVSPAVTNIKKDK